MDRISIGIIVSVATLILMGMRVPIGISMGVTSFFGLWALSDLSGALGMITAIPYSTITDWNLSAVPMFYVMGFVAARCGLTEGLFQAMRVLMGNIPGALASATVVASALFASASGSSVATAASFSRIAVPEMLKSNYDKGLATATVAAAGTLGSLIPPSVLMIIYAIFVDTSIQQCFVGGVIPGILTAFVYISMITIRVKINPSLAPREERTYTNAEVKAAISDIWPLPVLIVGVLGGIMFGIFSPTAAAAVGAVLAMVMALFRKKLTRQALWSSLVESAVGTSNVYIIVIGASIFSRLLALSRLPNELSDMLLGLGTGPLMIVILMAIVYLILGCFVEATSLILLTLPIFNPILSAMNVNLVWFCILVIKLLEIGLCTPPLGINVYVVKGSLGDEVTLQEVFKGVFWFVGVDVCTLAVLIAFPGLTLWLPSLVR